MKNLLLYALLGLVVFSCQPDPNDPGSNGKMTVEKDGVSFTITEFNNSLLGEQQLTEFGRRLDLRANVDGGTLVISVSNWDFQNPPEDGIITKTYDTNTDFEGTHEVCKETANASFCDGGMGTYIIGGTNYISEGFNSQPEGEIIITENDPVALTVSGTFDFEVFDLFGQGDLIHFKGTFTDLKYISLL